MGQSLSKRIATRLSSASREYEKRLRKEAIEDVERKRAEATARAAGGRGGGGASDPSALYGGFTRGQHEGGVGSFGESREREQESFLKHSGSRDAAGVGAVGGGVSTEDDGPLGDAKDLEMPEDLIKFLNNAGPLERKVDKSMTSPRVYESLEEEEEQRRQREEEAKLRSRRDMPMVEGDDTLTTTRTTSFSTYGDGDDPSDLRLTPEEMHDVLAARTTGGGGGAVDDSAAAADAYLDERFPPQSPPSSGSGPAAPAMSQEDRRRNHVLLRGLYEHLGLPVLMKDTDGSYVGAWDHRVEDLRRMNLEVVDTDVDSDVRFGYENRGDYDVAVARGRGEESEATAASSAAAAAAVGETKEGTTDAGKEAERLWEGTAGTKAFLEEESKRVERARGSDAASGRKQCGSIER